MPFCWLGFGSFIRDRTPQLGGVEGGKRGKAKRRAANRRARVARRGSR